MVKTDEPFQGEDQKSGLVTFDNGDDMFYWLFRSRRDKDNDPIVMWLTGGPGCSSETALFYENGPFSLDDNLNLVNNTNSWNDVANVVYVD
jgi:cathepsin A (carboxypeptidase C)